MDDWARPARANSVRRSTLIWLTLSIEGGLFVAAAVLGLLLGERFWENAHFTLVTLALGGTAGLALLAVAILVTESPLRIAVQIRQDIRQIIGIFDGATLLDLLLISILAGAGEEVFFRGVLQSAASAYLGVPAAIVVVSLLFGLMHPISWAYIVFTVVLSACFGVLYTWTGNIVVPVVAHAAYDFAALVYGVRFRRFAPGDTP